MPCFIVPMLADHWNAVRRIYAEGIATGNATFETQLPDWENWDSYHRQDCRLVAVEDDIVGWAALSPISARQAYRGVAEVSVYVAAAARGRGIGKDLLEALIQQSETNGIWTLQASIFPENTASIALHNSCGFCELGIRRKIAKLSESWRDVALLERRSNKVGV